MVVGPEREMGEGAGGSRAGERDGGRGGAGGRRAGE